VTQIPKITATDNQQPADNPEIPEMWVTSINRYKSCSNVITEFDKLQAKF
jgi:hypothetical protein